LGVSGRRKGRRKLAALLDRSLPVRPVPKKSLYGNGDDVGLFAVDGHDDINFALAGKRARQRPDVELIEAVELTLRHGPGKRYGNSVYRDGDLTAEVARASREQEDVNLGAFRTQIERNRCEAGVEDQPVGAGSSASMRRNTAAATPDPLLAAEKMPGATVEIRTVSVATT